MFVDVPYDSKEETEEGYFEGEGITGRSLKLKT